MLKGRKTATPTGHFNGIDAKKKENQRIVIVTRNVTSALGWVFCILRLEKI